MLRFFETKFEKAYLTILLLQKNAQICWLHIRIIAVEFAHNSIVCGSILKQKTIAVKSALHYLYTSEIIFTGTSNHSTGCSANHSAGFFLVNVCVAWP